MADTFTSTLGTIVMGIGGDNNQWGTNLNNSVFQILEDAIANILTSAVTGGTLDLSANPPPAGPSAARYAGLVFAGTLTQNQIVKVPNLSKFWWVKVQTGGGFTLSMQTPSGTPVVVPSQQGTEPASWQLVICDGSNNIFVMPYNGNQAFMPDGLAAFPPYTFVNENTTGFYRHGTQDVRLAINGADVLQVTGAGAGTPSVMNLMAGALQVAGAQVVPAGVEAPYAGITAPSGWLFEFGQAIARTGANANLFAAITATATGNTHSNTTLDNLSTDLRGLGLEGAFIEGTGIPTGTTIASIGSASALTLSQAATSTGSGLNLRILPYGQGDGSTTFNVPDRRGRSLFGRDNMGGAAASRITVNAGTHLSATGGEETHTLVTGEMPAHNHTINITDNGHSHTAGVNSSGANTSNPHNAYPANAASTNIYNTSSNPDFLASAFISTSTTGISAASLNTGGGSAHNTMPNFGITNMIIKT
jgi:microcystin-dependent protein